MEIKYYILQNDPAETDKEPGYFAAVLSDKHVIEGVHNTETYNYRVVSINEMAFPAGRCLHVSEPEFYRLLGRRAKSIRHFVNVYSTYLGRLSDR